MDNSNELRSELNRVQQYTQRDRERERDRERDNRIALDTLEEMREHNVDTIYNWIEGEDERDYEDYDAHTHRRTQRSASPQKHSSAAVVPLSRNVWDDLPLTQMRRREAVMGTKEIESVSSSSQPRR